MKKILKPTKPSTKPRLTLLCGEPGVGKSYIANLLAEAEPNTHRIEESGDDLFPAIKALRTPRREKYGRGIVPPPKHIIASTDIPADQFHDLISKCGGSGLVFSQVRLISITVH